MSYLESYIDSNLRKWFQNDNSRQLLRSIELRGSLRGLSSFNVDFNYPITAIAGKNGSGKSTILALACCAFHNNKNGFTHINRKLPYYTFVDFFIQHKDEVSPEGLEIWYGIAHNRWRITKDNPDKETLAYQVRKKKKGGKWNNYDQRVPRNVVFLGIERIVPHNEKSQSKSYKKSFSQSSVKGWEEEVRKMVGRVIGKTYDDFKYATHSKYRLPIITSNGKTYSGFNMGAGENALFEVFSILYAVPEGAPIVIDEIELGLHAEAQTKFVQALKEVCFKRKLQIICTTHSKEIFEQLPDDARVFIESDDNKTSVITGVSPEYAFSKMSEKNVAELSILVEDNVAKTILESSISNHLRTRVNIEVIGSASSLARHLGTNFQRENRENIIVVFDGDQRNMKKVNRNTAYSASESENKSEFFRWFREHIAYLPGDMPPEKWLINKAVKNIKHASVLLRIGESELRPILNQILNEKTHDLLYFLSEKINVSRESLLNHLCSVVVLSKEENFDALEEQIRQLIK